MEEHRRKQGNGHLGGKTSVYDGIGMNSGTHDRDICSCPVRRCTHDINIPNAANANGTYCRVVEKSTYS